MADFYNVAHYARSINVDARRAFRGRQLRIGEAAPDFLLPTVHPEGELSLAEETARCPVALVFGCLSAPPFVQELPAIDRLSRSLDPASARVVAVYTREIHPGESLPPHRAMSEKFAAARMLADELGLALTVAVDDLEGSTHRRYGGLPSMAVVVDRGGMVVHRAEWASASQLGTVLGNLASRARFQRPLVSYSETMWYMDGGTREEHEAHVRRAGERAVSDARDGPPSQDL